MNIDNIITVNAGGRHFVTARNTLASSSAGFFRAMLARWNSTVVSDNNNNSVRKVTPCGKNRKRARSDDEEGGPSNNKIVFIDCDPDIFEDVLYFMRRRLIKPSTANNSCRLQQLCTEAQFFSYDALSEACEAQIRFLQKKANAVPKRSTTARYGCSKIERNDENDDEYISIPEGHVLYLTSAVLVGECRIKRYSNKSQDLQKEKETTVAGAYLATCEKDDTGDFQLLFNIYDSHGQSFFGEDDVAPRCITHVGLDQIRRRSENNATNFDFRYNLGLCLAPPNGLKGDIMLTSMGSGSWNVHWWVGLPEDIPNLSIGKVI
mmetsp:Transcript_3701/g.5433  ORF Transcript_3701/g.5433 Transcript_3701/m.5433 type:complete len:320 (-) Transcript_3701:52-1011(-)